MTETTNDLNVIKTNLEGLFTPIEPVRTELVWHIVDEQPANNHHRPWTYRAKNIIYYYLDLHDITANEITDEHARTLNAFFDRQLSAKSWQRTVYRWINAA